MTRRLSTSWTGQSQSTWPLVLLLLVAVAVPAACVLWFMTEAMRNEQLAVQGRLTAVYQGQLETLRQRLDGYWHEKEAALKGIAPDRSASEIFAELVRSGVTESVIVYDASGQVAYPRNPSLETTDQISASPEWHLAWALEFQEQDYQAAANAFLSLADRGSSANTAAQALRSQARCLVKGGQQQAAFEILTEKLAQTKYRNAIDQQGRFLFPDAQLRALELMVDSNGSDFQTTLETLVVRLEDYSDPPLPGSQRRFLMRQLPQIVPDCPDFSTLAAETLAADYLDYRQANPRSNDGHRFQHSGFDDIWELPLLDRSTRLIVLFKEERIFKEMQSLVETELAIPDASVKLIPRHGKSRHPEAFLTGSAGEYLPDWQLGLWLDDQDPIGTAANSRIAMYLYSGIVVVLAMVALAGFVARNIGRQIRVTRLRNDLIATVSHELKTPLASIRALIETLLEGRYHDEAQHREYLQLAAKENERLSRLIDNFLAFSRMERNKEAFEFSEVDVEKIITAAVEAVSEKFNGSESRLDIEIADDLPTITGDAEALVTVLVNLLDNAHKYTESNKQITLRACRDHGRVRLEVEDNGVGLTRHEAKRVFDRFHQVDQSLSRRAGGCGLGLSIVQFIVKAHCGSVEVSSQSGRGSIFSVTLPVTGNISNHRNQSIQADSKGQQ